MGVFNYKLNRDLKTSLPPPPLEEHIVNLSRRHMAKRAADKTSVYKASTHHFS